MSTSKAVQDRRRWRRWIKRLEPEVKELVVSMHIFTETRAIVAANREIQTPDEFHDWWSRNYAWAASVRVRQVCDVDPRSVSLVRLLKDIARTPGSITRRCFARPYRAEIQWVAERRFDTIAGKGAVRLPASVPAKDLKQLRQAESRIRVFVNKQVAHLDRMNRRRKLPKYSELHGAITLIERLYVKYERLLLSRGPGKLLPTWLDDWRSVFRKPWLPPA